MGYRYHIFSHRPLPLVLIVLLLGVDFSVATRAGAWGQPAGHIVTDEADASTVVSTHFSSAKRYSDVDAKSPALLHAQASIKAYRRTDSSRRASSREGSASPHSKLTGSGGVDREEDLDDMEEMHDSLLKGPMSHVVFSAGQTIGISRVDAMLEQTDSGLTFTQVLPLEDVSLLEGGVGPKKKANFLRSLRH